MYLNRHIFVMSGGGDVLLGSVGFNIFYFINSTCDIHMNISNKGGIRTKSRMLIEFLSQGLLVVTLVDQLV